MRLLLRRHPWSLAGCLLFNASVLWLAFCTNAFSSCAGVRRVSVTELRRWPEQFRSRDVRVVGTLVKGSVLRGGPPCSVLFALAQGDGILRVRYSQCLVPESFQCTKSIDIPVTVEGRLGDSGEFNASAILVKTYLLKGPC